MASDRLRRLEVSLNTDMVDVIFDSSFLMAIVDSPTEWRQDFLEELGGFEPVLLDCVRAELQSVASGGGKRAKTARAALAVASGFRQGPCGGSKVDDEVISAGLRPGCVVATVDSEMMKSLRALHASVVTLKSGRVHTA